MISRLTGTLVENSLQAITLDVHDVGYQIFVTEQWKAQVVIGTKYTLSIKTVVKDDAIELFGFGSQAERQLFELLLTVSGVGPRTALSIIGYGVSGVHNAVVTADVDFFSSIPRIGKKNAQKIIIELKNKLGGLIDPDLTDAGNSKRQELSDALTSMGFARSDVQDVLKKSMDEEGSLEENLKKALKLLGRK